MELITKAPKGTRDLLPGESEKWTAVENVMADEAELNGFAEIRTPVFEHTELFLRSVGETTDVVEKQMYTFEDKGGRSVTLRPEGTAGAVSRSRGQYRIPVARKYAAESLRAHRCSSPARALRVRASQARARFASMR